MSIAARILDDLHGMTPADFDRHASVDRRQLADPCRHSARPTDEAPAAAASGGIITALRDGERAQNSHRPGIARPRGR